MPATFRKTIEIAQDVPVEDPSLASFTLHIRKRPESPECFVTVEIPGPAGPTLSQEKPLTALVDQAQADAFLATCVQVQTASLQVSEYTTDSVDVRPLPVKQVLPVEGGGAKELG